MAEAGANRINQLAFTLSNGFTFVEDYLARGMHVDDFAPDLKAFSSPTAWTRSTRCSGRLARRIWSVAMRERCGANMQIQAGVLHVEEGIANLNSRTGSKSSQ